MDRLLVLCTVTAAAALRSRHSWTAATACMLEEDQAEAQSKVAHKCVHSGPTKTDMRKRIEGAKRGQRQPLEREIVCQSEQ